MYIAVIGDIIGSKQLANRRETQEALFSVLQEINRRYKNELVSNFTITLGDEFQGLLNTPLHLLEMMDIIKYQMEPVDIRFGVGFGAIDTAIQREVSIGADGPAYWYARAAIEAVHEENDYERSRVLIKTGNDNPWLNVTNESLKLCDFIESRWRHSQKELMKLSILDYGYDLKVPQKELAKKLAISVQAVNQRIQSAGYYQYLRMKQTISTTLVEKWEGIDDSESSS